MEHEGHAVGSRAVTAEIDLEGQVEIGVQVKALIGHHRAVLVQRVLRQGEDVTRGVVMGVTIERYVRAHLLRQQLAAHVDLDRRRDGGRAIFVDGKQHPIARGQDVGILRQLNVQRVVWSSRERQLDLARCHIQGMGD